MSFSYEQSQEKLSLETAAAAVGENDEENTLNKTNVQNMMGLYAAIINGDKSEVKKTVTGALLLLKFDFLSTEFISANENN